MNAGNLLVEMVGDNCRAQFMQAQVYVAAAQLAIATIQHSG
jgi:hypothetical protein